jgi:hypothetical protein
MRSTIALAGLLAGASLIAAPQQTRDGAQQPKGSGIIAGIVVAGDTGLPIRSARVALTGTTLQQGVGRMSDDQGAFAFTGLEAGQYRLWATHLGYVTASYGEKRPGSGVAGRPIVIADKQHVDKLQLSLPRAAAIEGIVTDQFGPASAATVQALRVVYRGGRRGLMSAGVAPVNDRGEYRLFSLPPGEYLVHAASTPGGLSLTETFQTGFANSRVRAANAPAILTELGPWMRESTQPTAATGFYPGGFSIESATTIELAAGEERRGADVRVTRQPIVKVSGVVRSSRGPAAGATIWLVPGRSRLEEFSDGTRIAGMAKSADGTFQITGVPAGNYVLVAVLGTSTSAEGVEVSQQEIAVGTADVTGLQINLTPAAAVSGTVAADDGSPVEWPKVISFTPVDTYFVTGPAREHNARAEEGRFALAGLLPGRFRLTLHNEPRWRIASATSGGRDVMDTYLDVAAGDKPSLRIVLTRRETELSGTLGGLSADSNYTVIAFSPDERHWVPEGRRLAAVEPTPAGQYTFKALPPGTYRLALLEDYDAAAGLYPDLLRQLSAASSIFVTLTDGEKKVQDLRVR